MESRPDEFVPETDPQTSIELKKLKDRIDYMVARAEAGQLITVQSVRLLDALVLEVMRRRILNARERSVEFLDRARATLESTSPVEIAVILKTDTGAKRSALVKRLRAISELASTLRGAASPP